MPNYYVAVSVPSLNYHMHEFMRDGEHPEFYAKKVVERLGDNLVPGNVFAIFMPFPFLPDPKEVGYARHYYKRMRSETNEIRRVFFKPEISITFNEHFAFLRAAQY